MNVKAPKIRVETVKTTKKVSKTSVIQFTEENQVKTNKSLHQCPKCMKYFGSKFGLNKHPRTSNSNNEIEAIDNSETGKSFYDFILLKNHSKQSK